jgi:putative holliday junction resolvase
MPNDKIVLGLDFGMKKIGVAIGNTITGSAKPLQPIKAVDGIPNWDLLQELVSEWGADAFVVGFPLNMDGSEQPISLAAKKFARRLKAKFNLPVYLVDERLSTKEAQSLMRNNQNLANHSIDSLAAKIIIESWLRGKSND